MNIIVLNSGSNGNAVYVESPRSGAAVLLDCGISRRQIEVRLKVHGRYLQNVRGLFITHEHADHVRGVPVTAKMYRMPTFLTEATWRGLRMNRPHKGHRFIRSGETVKVEDISVQAFPKSHDAQDPVFFLVTIGELRFLYVTDLGVHNDEVARLLGEVDAALLESNYDEHMLNTGPYPEHLKERIRAPHGHLSNLQAMELIERHCNGRLHTLIFGHLSENNNTPEIVQREIDAVLARRPDFRPRIVIASRYEVGEVLSVG
ncbi:MAG: MBL fold metallo-hydrolase [Bacteroidetes bacterium]|nr:MBL fold metallo-hydrolase [Bacteroidota bacterium]